MRKRHKKSGRIEVFAVHGRIIVITGLAILLFFLTGIALAGQWVVGDFSGLEPSGEFPEQWEPLTFRNIDRHTSYSLVYH